MDATQVVKVFHVRERSVRESGNWKDRAAGWAHRTYTGRCDRCKRDNATVKVFGTVEDARWWLDGGHACDRCEEC